MLVPHLLHEYIKSLKLNDELMEKMVRSRQKVDVAYEPAFDLHFVFDKEGKYLFVNFIVANKLGIKPVDMEGKHWQELGISDHIMEQVEEGITRVLASQEVFVKTINFINPLTLEMNYYETTFSPLYDSQGNCLAVHNIAKDITARVKAEEKLARQTQLFVQLIEKAPLAISVVDCEGKILYCNDEFAGMIPEASKSELIDKSISVVADKMSVTYEKLAIVRTLRKKEVLAEHQKAFGKDWLVNTFPLLGYNGDILGGTAMIQDITQTVAVQKELRKLDRLNLVGQMAGGVAHEIRNPLTVAIGYLQFLSKKIPAEVSEQFQIVLAELLRIEDIIANFLAVAGNKPTERKLHDLNRIVRDILPLMKADAITHNIEVKADFAEEMPQLMLNEKELKQVLLNLSRNGIEAMKDKGVLGIKTVNEQNEILLVVSDSGSGIPEKAIDHIFNPFYTTKEGGAGLGLAICESIVRKHRGKIIVHTEEGKGSRFVISFPKTLCSCTTLNAV
jgi:PAS domain S-box-containing protein